MSRQMDDAQMRDPQPVPARLTPLFEARWSYDEFERLMPFGAPSEGQAYAYSTSGRVAGDAISGSLRLTQYPRIRAGGILLPDAHGLIQTLSGEQVVVHAAGYVVPVPDAPGDWTISHWMRFWTDAPSLAWLNESVAFGVGEFVDEKARVRYFAAAPASEPSDLPDGAPALDLLGTARWEYPEYDAVRMFGDAEGAGYATSAGTVEGGPVAGSWRGWHYPTYLRNGLYQLDAHAEIRSDDGVILNRHAGLASRPLNPADGMLYDVVQHATFTTEIPRLGYLNQTLALGIGFVREPGLATVSYYSLSAPTRS